MDRTETKKHVALPGGWKWHRLTLSNTLYYMTACGQTFFRSKVAVLQGVDPREEDTCRSCLKATKKEPKREVEDYGIA